MPKLHLISGLPRSGSTLLAAILRQNPRFIAAMTSPVASLCGGLLPKMSGTAEFAMFFTDEKRRRILRNIFSGYYAEAPNDSVIFDTNRAWTGRLSLVDALFPSARVICCVREVNWILDSIERLIRKNPAHVPRLFNEKVARTVYGRVESLMEPESGLVGLSWSSLREAWFSEHTHKLIVVRYDRLTSDPQGVMRRLYQEIGETPAEHDFNNLNYEEPEFDARSGTPGLHSVKRKIAVEKRETILPPDLFQKYADADFWTKAQLNAKNVLIL